MTPERWQRIQSLLHTALAMPVEDRARYVTGVCAGDAELQRDVESLLAQASQGSGFLSAPAFDLAVIPADRNGGDASLVGRTIGTFSIKARLGSGGMGDVYLADDSALRRPVAIKALREDGPPTAEGRDRLLREARAAAALNHPNIATIFHVLDSVDAVTPPLMVMEYVEGDTLSALLASGPLPMNDALRFARDVADALCAAHHLGIVHRDLKPANLRVNQQRRIKVLDFGLARRLAPAVDTSTMTVERALQTIAPHRIAGTPGYTAPEQALGRLVEPPADIFSLGVVLFEMLTGRRPFPGDDLVSAGIAMMTLPTPRVADFVRGIPPSVDALLSRMLAREPAARPSAQEVLDQLDRIASGATTVSAGAVPSRRVVQTVALLVGVGIVAAAVTVGIRSWRAVRNPAPPDRPAIAVLPLDNLSGDRSKDYLGVGIAESLTTSLAHLSSVSVISRTSLSDSSRGGDLRTVARDVGATLVLQGSVQQSGDRLRVNAKLLRPDGSVAWAGEADSELSDLFTLETRLAGSVIAGLSVDVSAQERQTAIAPLTRNAQALDAYWQGVAFMDRGDPASLRSAISILERATTLDPQFAAALGALGDAYRRQYGITPDKSLTDKALAALQRGLAIEPERTEVRNSLATLYLVTGRASDAAVELREVIKRHPENDDAHSRLGVVLSRLGRADEALVEFQTAVSLRPQYWGNHQALGNFYYTQKQLPEAIAEFTRAIQIRPDSATLYSQRGGVFTTMRDRVRARADHEQAIRLDPSNPSAYSNLGFLAFEEGRYADAAQSFAAAIKLRPKRALYHRNLGDAYLKLNRTADARSEYLAAVTLTLEALAVNPGDATALSQLAVYEAKIGRAQDARRHADEAVVRNGANPDVLFRRGVTLALAGDTDAAITALKVAVEHGYSVEQLRTEDDLATLANVPRFRSLVLSKQ